MIPAPMFARPIRTGLRSIRNATIWLASAMYVFAVSGIPLPTVESHDEHQAHSGEHFPCMEHACGCRTAEQCWLNCCCHTISERLAWAEEHKVQPPAALLVLAACTEHEHGESEGKACCEDQACRTCHVDAKPAAPARGISILQALKCRGTGTTWLACCAAVPLNPFDCSISLAVTDWLQPCTPASNELDAFPPPVPPPRCLV